MLFSSFLHANEEAVPTSRLSLFEKCPEMYLHVSTIQTCDNQKSDEDELFKNDSDCPEVDCDEED